MNRIFKEMPVAAGVVEEGDAGWNDYVHAHPESTHYHQYEWKGVIERSFGHATSYLAAREPSGALCGILPLVYMRSALFGRFLVSLPFFNYGGLLCTTPAAEERLLDEAERIREQLAADYLELRHLRRYDYGLATKQHKVTMILDLERTPEDQWKAFDPKLRNQIRKAMKSGLALEVGDSEYLNVFYAVFALNMRDLGTPVYSKEFFRNILLTFPETTKLFSVRFKGTVIASGLALWHKDTFEIPWASSIAEFRSLCPNNLLYWGAISYAIEHGFRKFDFGRSSPGEGTYRFKEQWGARPAPLYWQYFLKGGMPLPELNPKNKKFQLAIKVWKKLPVKLTCLVGPGIVKNIP